MLSCKKVAQLASESLDRSLTLQEKLSMRLHLLACKLCSRYVRQLKFLKHVCAHADEDHSGSGAGLTKGAQSKLLRSYVTVRNKAFHAEWDKIDEPDIRSVIGFVEQFLLTHFGATTAVSS